jgi:hypothetical protein
MRSAACPKKAAPGRGAHWTPRVDLLRTGYDLGLRPRHSCVSRNSRSHGLRRASSRPSGYMAARISRRKFHSVFISGLMLSTCSHATSDSSS